MSVGSKGAPVQQRATAGQSPVVAVLTLRDFFAAKAAVGYLAAHGNESANLPAPANVASYAYRVADAMLAEREGQS